MPKYWHDRHSISRIEDPAERFFQLSIVADKKPYFMRLVYPALAKQYNTYIKTTNKNSIREFGISLAELEKISVEMRTERQSEFLKYYYTRLPVGIGDCVMNKICRRFETEFEGILRKYAVDLPFDYSVMKSNCCYEDKEKRCVDRIYTAYVKRLRDYMIFAEYEYVDADEVVTVVDQLKSDFIRECCIACPDFDALCNIILDICYTRSTTKRFAWDICGTQIIKNLLSKNGWLIRYPALSVDGDITYCGKSFSILEIEMEEDNVDYS